MSVAEGLKRVLDIRNAIRGKMVALGLSQGNDNFDQVKTSVENIIDNTKKTDTATAIQGVFSSGQTGAVFSTGLQGYSSDASMVKVPVSNLASENIKEGVNIGGVVGEVQEMGKICILNSATLGTSTIYCNDSTIKNNKHTIPNEKFVALIVQTGGSGGSEYFFMIYRNHGLDIDSDMVYHTVRSNSRPETENYKVNAGGEYTCSKRNNIYTAKIIAKGLNLNFTYNEETGELVFNSPSYFSQSSYWGLYCSVLYNT